MAKYRVYLTVKRDSFDVEAEDSDDAIDTAKAELDFYGGLEWYAEAVPEDEK